jgi:hypothetical protein
MAGFEGLEKEAQNGYFWPVLISSKIDVFLTPTHHQHIKKMRL